MDEIPFSFSLNTDTVVALVTLAGVILSIGYARLANREATAANQAVNGRGPGEPVIYDMVFDTYKKVTHMEGWKDSYEGGPLDSGPKVVQFVDKVDVMHGELVDLKKSMNRAIQDIEKYGCPVKKSEQEGCQNK